MRVSIVIAVLDSPEVVRRQCLHFDRFLPEGVEVVLVDDKSDPPLAPEPQPWLRVLKAPRIEAQWTQPAARNFGVREARGDMVICTDIDHIIRPELLEAVMRSNFDMVKFRREAAVLNEAGEFVQTLEAVAEYGYRKPSFHLPPHTNSFAIRRDLYLELGGVSERRVGSGHHPNREEVPLRRNLRHLQRRGDIKVWDETGPERPILYMIPNGRFCGHKDFNPFGLFHNLKRKE